MHQIVIKWEAYHVIRAAPHHINLLGLLNNLPLAKNWQILSSFLLNFAKNIPLHFLVVALHPFSFLYDLLINSPNFEAVKYGKRQQKECYKRLQT